MAKEKKQHQQPEPTPEDNSGFDELLEFLKRTRGFDFGAYKRPSLMRRVRRRMELVGIHQFSEYLDRLQVDPGEFAELFDSILINVTAFFRDPESWQFIRSEVVPKILEKKQPEEPIRIWSAGCASGEEAYSLAMLMGEALGLDACADRVKIYATDIDEDALNLARQASYPLKSLADVPPELVDKYFEPAVNGSDKRVFNRGIRRCVIFGRHDLLQDAPIPRVDLLVCRNTIMYFNAEAHDRVLARFFFALNPHGVLFLGRAEMLISHGSLFQPLDLKRRVFVPAPKAPLRDRLLLLSQNGRMDTVNHLVSHVRLREAAFESDPVPQLVVDPVGTLLMCNERARSLFNLSTRDVGRPLQDLEVSYRPIELRSMIDQAQIDARAVTRKDVEIVHPGAESSWYDVNIIPLMENGGTLAGTKVVFNDISGFRKLQEDLRTSAHELETAYEELQSTNEELQTTNEELQSANEELETTNEELQSANEEMETMNEELQSTNEELETVNSELRQRSEQLNQVNSFLSSILSSLHSGVIVLNRELEVQIWNRRCEELWGLRYEEVAGKNFFNLDIGLPVAELRPMLRGCLAGESRDGERMLEAVNRRGKPIQCRIRCSALPADGEAIEGTILLIEEEHAGSN